MDSSIRRLTYGALVYVSYTRRNPADDGVLMYSAGAGKTVLS